MASKARVRFKLAQVAEKSRPQEAMELYQLALDETDIVWLGVLKSLKYGFLIYLLYLFIRLSFIHLFIHLFIYLSMCLCVCYLLGYK